MQTLFLRIPVVSLADSLNHRLRALIPSGSLTRTFAEVSFGIMTGLSRVFSNSLARGVGDGVAGGGDEGNLEVGEVGERGFPGRVAGLEVGDGDVAGLG